MNAGAIPSKPHVLVRVYRGSQQSDAVAAFNKDAERLAATGYQPTSQSWAQGQWGCGAFLVALLLCVVLIGILALIYMLIVKPDGTLTVTYQRATVSAVAAHEPPRTPASKMKMCSRCGESAQLTDTVCRFCGYNLAPAALGTRVPVARAEPPQPPDEVVALGQWEVVESVSEYIRRGATVWVNMDPRVITVSRASITSGIPLKEAVVEAEGNRLRLLRGPVRQFELVPTDGQDLGATIEAIRDRKDPTRRDEASTAPAVAPTPTFPPPAVPEPAPSTLETRLATLERLRSSGMISEDEYAARRTKILDEI